MFASNRYASLASYIDRPARLMTNIHQRTYSRTFKYFSLNLPPQEHNYITLPCSIRVLLYWLQLIRALMNRPVFKQPQQFTEIIAIRQRSSNYAAHASCYRINRVTTMVCATTITP